MNQACILVLGMHRSGTSSVAGCLNEIGVYGGNELLPGSDDNKKGHFENLSVLRFNEKVLKESGATWDDPMLSVRDILFDKYIDELIQLIREEFYGVRTFYIKEPRICHLLPLYLRALKKLSIKIKILIPYRHPLEIASSLRKRNGFSPEKSILLWTSSILESEFQTRGEERYIFPYENFLTSPVQVLQEAKVLEPPYIDTAVNKDSLRECIESFVDPGLRHHTYKKSDYSNEVPEFTKKLFIELNNRNFYTGVIDEIRSDYIRHASFFYGADTVGFVDELKNQIDIKNARISELKEAYSKEQKLHLNFKELVVEKNDALILTKNTISEIKTDIRRLQEKYKSGQLELVSNKNRIAELKNDVRSLQEKCKSRQDALEAERELNLQLKRSLDTLERSNKDLKNELDKYKENKNKIDELNRKNNHLLEKNSEKDRKISSLIHEIVSIHTTRSWRYTRLFRIVVKVVKRIFHK
ncbi:sulfotransferase family protein [Nitrincola tapanii]|uniref:Sulfotransferase family protein n=1 Tax=Nitrincola tapanii TaxID=1708751 RepID=A0A5A9W1P7_9GAMM|nr:hypothetical protein [Nitrincola tapanii]KAA0874404.1 hypothetical protein E1H14_09025 [Nitrincola tapanii]